MNWYREFDESIPIPRGRELVTLKDAGNYITKLPKAEHQAPEMASGDRGLDPGRDEGRADDACSDRDHASVEPPRRTCLRTVGEKASLGKAEA